jgi:transposase
MHYVEVKSAEHQARAVAFRTHQCFVRQRTQLINALRGHLGEFGIVVARGPANLTAVAGILADETNDLPESVRGLARLYLDPIGLLTDKIDGLMLKLREATKENEDMRRLCTVPGVGPVTAGAILAFAPMPLKAAGTLPPGSASCPGGIPLAQRHDWAASARWGKPIFASCS